MRLPNTPDRPLDFGIIKGQTRLLTTKALHEVKEPNVVPTWLSGTIFIVIVLGIILGFYTLLKNNIFLTKPERIAMEDFKSSPETQDSRIESYVNNKKMDRELIWSVNSREFSEEFLETYSLSDVERFDGFSINWYGADGIHRNWFYYMAKVDGKWIIAGISKSVN